jgi:tetratricopeptide (TPR) repeat protein
VYVVRPAGHPLPVFTSVSDANGLGKAYALMGQAHASEGRYLRAAEAFGHSRSFEASASDELLRAQTVGGLAFSLWRGPTPAPEAIARCEALLAALPGSCRLARVAAMCPLSVLLASRSRTAEADALLEEAEQLVADFAHEYARISVSLFIAAVRTLAGDLAAAEERLRLTCAALARLGGGVQYAAARGDLIKILLRSGRVEQAAELLRAEPAAADEPDFPSGWFGARARLHCAHGDHSAAQTSARTALRLAFGTDSPEIQAATLLDQAHLHRALGRAEHARRASERARERFRAKGHLVGLAEAVRFLEPVAGR